jgi:uncharacterized protein (UPF0335 family)
LVSGELQGLSISSTAQIQTHPRLNKEQVVSLAPFEVSLCEEGAREDSHIAWFTNGTETYVSNNFLNAKHITTAMEQTNTAQQKQVTPPATTTVTTTAAAVTAPPAAAAAAAPASVQIDPAALQTFAVLASKYGDKTTAMLEQVSKITQEAQTKGMDAQSVLNGVVEGVTAKLQERQALVTAALTELEAEDGEFVQSMIDNNISESEAAQIRNIFRSSFEQVPGSAIVWRTVTAKRPRTVDHQTAQYELKLNQLTSDVQRLEEENKKLKEEKDQLAHTPSFVSTYAMAKAKREQQATAATVTAPATKTVNVTASATTAPAAAEAPKLMTQAELNKQFDDAKSRKWI